MPGICRSSTDDGGVHVTDGSNASRTLCMNRGTLRWDDALLDFFGIPRGMMPAIRPSSAVYGTTKADGPFGGEVPGAGDLGDRQAALFGQACYRVGEAKNAYGTGCFLLHNIGEKPVLSRHGLLATVAYGLEEGNAVYALEGSIAMAWAAVQ